MLVGMIYRTNTQLRVDVDIFASTLIDIIYIVNSEGKISRITGRCQTPTYLNLELMVKHMIMLIRLIFT